jgi:hypothetical protein
MNINYVIGDATSPRQFGENDAIKIICHICNNAGGWGSGFVVALSSRFGRDKGSPERSYRDWYKAGEYEHEDSEQGLVVVPFNLGRFQLVPVDVKQLVCNMVAQNEMGGLYEEGIRLDCPNVNYSSLYECFLRLRARLITHFAANERIELHMPRIGCGLGGGTWSMVEAIIRKALADTNFEIFVYDPPVKK